MNFDIEMLLFIRECQEDRLKECKDSGHTLKEWYMRFDDKQNIKYSFFVGRSPVISQYTLFHYGYRVITISGDLLDGITKGLK